jgi:cysteinyl-tRNA synthetase
VKLTDSISNTLKDLPQGKITLYSCGPTVYNHAHIGNLRTFIMDDVLRRGLKAAGHDVQAVMNITDIDDKTIATSQAEYPDLEPMEALQKSTAHYEKMFLDDLVAVGVDLKGISIVRATERIPQMQAMIDHIAAKGFAYVSDGSIYFNLGKYREAGNAYGVLVNVDYEAQARVDNDEYDKQSAQDFVLWKAAKDGEPFWEYDFNGQSLPGRPGWHIECSAMALDELGDPPISIHSGGIDLKFPHHENEIAQVGAATSKPFCDIFVHHNHLYVDGKKMSKSLNNFYTLEDITAKGFSPLAFRLLALQAHHSSDLNFTWESLEAAQNTLANLAAWADLKHQQSLSAVRLGNDEIQDFTNELTSTVANDLDTVTALAKLFQFTLKTTPGMTFDEEDFDEILAYLDDVLMLGLSKRDTVDDDVLDLIKEREEARAAKEYALGDTYRTKLRKLGIEVDDTPNGTRWRRSSL